MKQLENIIYDYLTLEFFEASLVHSVVELDFGDDLNLFSSN
ncbi:MAG TPA: hypothetical protein VMW10_13195 [Alphaproteobacteria bacterium]|nr:hypothetical protein [Alphaproteobacteria bacterium]